MPEILFETVVHSFVMLFVIMDPVGVGAIFAGLTRGGSEAFKRRMALRGPVLAGLILLVFALGGDFVLRALGVSISAFRIAGGILLFLVAIDMLFAHGTALRRTTGPEEAEAEHKQDISVFPLAIPLIAGPGAMTSIVLLMGRAGDDSLLQLAVLVVLITVLLVLLAVLLIAARVVTLLGVTGINVITRVLGIILAALAVQFILDGVTEAFKLG